MCEATGSTQRVIGRRLDRSQGKWPSGIAGIALSVVNCRICDLIYPNPMPIPASIEDHYDIDPGEYWSPEYFSEDDKYFSDQISTFRRLSNVKVRPIALDIGAGLGKCMAALNRAGFEAFGIEGSRSFFKAAAEKGVVGVDHLKLATVETAEFQESSFDFITFGAVLEHLYDPSDAIRRSLKWLRAGGLIHIEVPSSRWLISRLGNLFYKLTGGGWVTNLSPMHPPYHLYEFGLGSFEQHALKNDYEIAHNEYYVASQTYLPQFADSFARRLMEMTKSGMQLEVWLRKKE